jgi:hypothetical protein
MRGCTGGITGAGLPGLRVMVLCFSNQRPSTRIEEWAMGSELLFAPGQL